MSDCGPPGGNVGRIAPNPNPAGNRIERHAFATNQLPEPKKAEMGIKELIQVHLGIEAQLKVQLKSTTAQKYATKNIKGETNARRHFSGPIPYVVGPLAIRGDRLSTPVPLFPGARRGALRKVMRSPRRSHEAHLVEQRGPRDRENRKGLQRTHVQLLGRN